MLLLKRRNVPMIMNPGIWAFLSGGRDGNERYLTTAYREIGEETSIGKESLRMLYKEKRLLKEDRKGIKWHNWLFIFHSNTRKVKLDYENSAYRWATMREIEKEINYTNVFINRKALEAKIRRYLWTKKR